MFTVESKTLLRRSFTVETEHRPPERVLCSWRGPMRYIFLLGSTSRPPSPHLVCQANLPTTPAFFNILGSRLKIAHHFHLFSSTSWLAGHWRFHATKKSHRIDFVSTHATCGASGWSSWVGHGWFLQDGADNRSWLMGSLLLQMEMALMEMEMAFTGSQGKLR